MASGRLARKIAVITGSSSGLGRAMALRFAREGARVVCSDLRPSALPQVPQELEVNTHDLITKNGGEAIFVTADAGDAQSMQDLVSQAAKAFGRVDVMVNNAGISIESKRPGPVHETAESDWDLTMRVNAKSVFLGCKYATGQMLKQVPHVSGDRGWIINISSIFGLVAGTSLPSYAAAKAAVANLTRSVALDYAPHRIHCNALCPGYTKTAIFADTTAGHWTSVEELTRKHPFGGPGVPEDIARAAVSLASEDASWMTGACIPVDGGYTAR